MRTLWLTFTVESARYGDGQSVGYDDESVRGSVVWHLFELIDFALYFLVVVIQEEGFR